MEYLKPIEILQLSIKRYQIIVIVLCCVLGLSIIFLPWVSKKAHPLLIRTDGNVILAETSPWKLSVTRLEQFTKAYLSYRFEWKADNFQTQKENLKILTTDTVFMKLKESLNTFDALARNQNAKSYFVLEDFGFSNAKKRIEARITRLVRINNLGIATPLTIYLSFEESSLTETNPYGLVVTGLEESEPNETSTK